MKEYIISPEGGIKFMAIKTPVKSFDGESKIYTVRLEFDGSSADGLAFKKELAEINDKKIVSDPSKVSKEGNFLVSFNSAYAPIVLDSKGNRLETDELPRFNSSTDTGIAKVEAAVSTAGKRPTIYLKAIQLLELDQVAQTQEESEHLTNLERTLQSSSAANS